MLGREDQAQCGNSGVHPKPKIKPEAQARLKSKEAIMGESHKMETGGKDSMKESFKILGHGRLGVQSAELSDGALDLWV